MGPYVAATVYALLAHGLAFAVLPWSIAFSWRIRAVLFWAVSAAIVFLIRSPPLVLFLVAVVLLLLMPGGNRDRAAFFVIAVAAVPTFLTAQLPFPGIRYLFDVSHFKICIIIILLPLIFLKRNASERNFSFGASDVLLVVFVFYLFIRTLLYATGAVASGVTGALRVLVDQMLGLAVPYILIRFAIRSLDDAAAFLQAILITAVLLASVTLFSALKQWDFYQLGTSNYVEFRTGYARINATMNNPSLGLFLTMGLLLTEVVRRQIDMSWFSLNSMRLILLLGLPMTDSRGAIGAAAVAGAVYFAMLSRSKIARRAALVALFYAAVLGILWLLLSDFTRISNDSFTYRQDLLRTSAAYIAKYPMFGDYNFYSSGYFDHLIQGQGIIDVTNMYLQIALQHGLLGAGLFFLAILIPAFALARHVLKEERQIADARRRRNRGRSVHSRGRSADTNVVESDEPAMDGSAGWRRARAAILASTAGWLFLVATTSDGGLIVLEGIMLAALCRALADLKPNLANQTALRSGRIQDLKDDRFGVDAGAVAGASRKIAAWNRGLPRASR